MSKIPYMVQLFSGRGGILVKSGGGHFGKYSLFNTCKILLKTQWIIVNKSQQSALYDRHTLRNIRCFSHLFSQKSVLYYRHTLRKNSTFWEFMVEKKHFRVHVFD